ncbi:MAG: hypothetical protein HZB16_05210 [Armatimonadetes bacterium]|nr:hypothetical protein [Armatimonadota bacterium]
MRKALFWLMAATVMVVARPGAAQTTADWTVLVYLNGDSTVRYEDASIRVFNALEQIGSTQAVNVVVQWDRGPGDDVLTAANPADATQAWATTRRYLVVADPAQTGLTPDTLTAAATRIASPALVDLGEVDMGQQASLVDFYTWTAARFPARHYALILSGPGTGWQPRSQHRGMLFDTTTVSTGPTDPSAFLTNAELTGALTAIKSQRSGLNLDALLCDTGGSATVEVATQATGLVDSYLGEFLDRNGNGGLNYDTLVSSLNTALPLTAATVQTWLGSVATTYLGSYGTGTARLGGAQSVTAGVYRMGNLPSLVTACDDLAKALDADLLTTAPGLFRVLSTVQRGRPADFSGDYIDLKHFAELCQTEFAATQTIVDAATALISAVTAVQAGDVTAASAATDIDVSNFNGVAVYFPGELAAYDSNYPTGCDFGQTEWPTLIQGLYTLYSDRNPPVITLITPTNGTTILENPPTIQVSIVDPDAIGGVNADSVSLTFDGVVVPKANYSFSSETGVLTYTPANALGATSHTFIVGASDLSGNAATPTTGNFRISVATLSTGIQTFSLPRLLTAAQNDPGLVFGASNFAMARWVPGLSGSDKYRLYPDSYASFLPPDCSTSVSNPVVTRAPAGLGYWVRVKQSRPLQTLPGTPVTLSEYGIRLLTDGSSPNWNMVANPYDTPAISLASAFIQLVDGRRLTFRQAIDQRYTPGVLFSYVPNESNANAPGRYDFSDAGAGQLIRLQAHWLKVNTACSLVVQSGLSSRAAVPSASARALPRDGWSLALWATADSKANAYSDGRAYEAKDRLVLGQSSDAQNGYDHALDVAGPPAMPGGVALRAVHGDWGLESGRYVRDYRAAGMSTEWDVEVAAPAGEVSLTWPDLRAVPGDIDLVLTDLTNGQSRALRTTASYGFTHSGGPRAFRVTAQRRNGAGLLVTNVTTQSGRGGDSVDIGYTLSRAASVHVQVTSLSGRSLRSLGPVDSATGRGRLAWDGCDANGRPVPNGIYVLQVVATGADGSLARELRTVRVMR